VKKTILSIFLFLSFITLYGQIQSYYNGLDLTKTEHELFLELSNKIINTHNAIPYSSSSLDTWDVLKQVDEDPDNASNVLLIYGFNDNDGIANTDRSRNKNLQDTGGGDPGKWNREHVFAKSLANPSLGTDEPGPGTDVHNLKPADSERNSDRSNRKFTDGSGNSGTVSSNGGWYPGDEWKGDVARIIMYMYLRYNGTGTQISQTQCLPVNIGIGNTLTLDPNMVDLFLNWNIEDPVSDFENQRNDYIETVQGNRNPFIDNPYLATLIWGGVNAEDKWNLNNSSDSEAPTSPTNLVATNTTFESVDISWDAATDNIGVVDYLIYLDGVFLKTAFSTSTSITALTPSTNYTITVKARDAASNLSEVGATISVTTLEGPTYLIKEDFNDCANVQFFTYSEASNKNWTCTSVFGENNSGSYGMNGHQEDVLSKDWLITTNPINFDENEAEKLSFYTSAAYGDSLLELVYSSNYDGSSNPGNFDWTPVPNINISLHSSGSSTEEIYTFSNVDISSITGTVYIAFKYYSNANPTRWTVDSFVITADNSDDVDNDGVLNENDLCPNTPEGEEVDENGCSYGQLDDDNDGVENSIDLCENTPIGEAVDENGCSESQLDDDNDGVYNNLDTCPNTPIGEAVDANGCSESQLDDDNDGVYNNLDMCPNTTPGSYVDASGCFTLPANNFTIETISETCPDKNNGQILISAQENYTYNVTLNGANATLQNNNLNPGNYIVCINVAGENYEQCYNVVIAEGTTISGKVAIAAGKASIQIEKGTAPFTVYVNNKIALETVSPIFTVNVNHGDIIEVKSNVLCEGVFSKSIHLFNEVIAYPNPTKGNIEITVPTSKNNVKIEIYTIQSQLISAKNYTNINGKVQLNINNNTPGVYFAKVYLEKPVMLKIIKE
jgi:endonuclease I